MLTSSIGYKDSCVLTYLPLPEWIYTSTSSMTSARSAFPFTESYSHRPSKSVRF